MPDEAPAAAGLDGVAADRVPVGASKGGRPEGRWGAMDDSRVDDSGARPMSPSDRPTGPSNAASSSRFGPAGAGGGGLGPDVPSRGSSSASASGPNPEERATRAALERAEAERRLREAEARLRVAVEELYNKHHKRTDRYSAVFSARHPLCMHGDSCVANALGSLCQSFLLAYSVRVGVGVLLRAFKLLRNRSFRSVLDLQLLLSEKNLIVREEAVRNGLLFGGFAGIYHAMRCILRRCTDRDLPRHTFIAGAVSGLSLFALDDPQKRRSFALYLLARLGQCVVNSPRAKSSLGPWLPSWRAGGVLLFALSSAQIMYAFAMRPETLPKSYFDFITKTGPIPAPVLEAVRRSVRGLPVDPLPLSAHLRKVAASGPGSKHRHRHGAASALGLAEGAAPSSMLHPTGLGPYPALVPCSVLHPRDPSCLRNDLLVMRDTFRKTFPLYLSLTFVPFVVLNLQKFMQSPMRTSWLATRSAVRSTAFLALFVGIYQAVICAHRQVAIKDHKLVYWLAGGLAGLSALVEKESRRTELALYTLPRAADSLWYILVHVHLLPDIKYAEVALYCLCLGGVVYYHEHEPSTMAPFLRGLITRFLHGTTGAPPPIQGPALAPGSATPGDAGTPGQGLMEGGPGSAASDATSSRIVASAEAGTGDARPWHPASASAASAGTAAAAAASGFVPSMSGSGPRPGAVSGQGTGGGAARKGEGGQQDPDWQLTAQRLEAAFQGL